MAIDENNIRYINNGEPNNEVTFNRPTRDLLKETNDEFVAQRSTSDGKYNEKTKNLSDVPDKSDARDNLGLGSSATKDSTPTATSGTVAERDANGTFEVGAPTDPAHPARLDDLQNSNNQLADAIENLNQTKAENTDPRLSDAREWTASTVSQTEAQNGTSTTRRAWTAQRVRQAIAAWWNGSTDKTKLDGIQSGAQVNVATNLGSSGTGGTRTITSSTGNNTSITYTAADLGAVPTGRTLTAGNGLTGGGNLGSNRTFTLGTPSTLSGSTSNGVTSSSHTHAISSTASRTSSSTSTLLEAKAMNDHRGSGDHDSRYVRNSVRQTLAAPSHTTEAVYEVGATSNAGSNATVIRSVMSGSNTVDRWLFEGVGSAGRVFTVATNGTITGNGSGLTSLNASNLSSGTVADARLPSTAVRTSRTISTGNGLSGGGNLSSNRTFSLTNIAAGSSSRGAVYYNGTTRSAGRFYGGTTNPTSTTRLNYDGNFHANRVISRDGVYSIGSDSSAVITGRGIYGGTGDSVRVASQGNRIADFNLSIGGDRIFSVHDGADNMCLRVRPKDSSSASPVRIEYLWDTPISSSANVYVSGSGNLYRSTSSIKYKKDVEDAAPEFYKKVLDLRPVFYRAKDTGDADLGWGYWGFIAEEVAEIDPRLVHWSVPDAEDEWADKTPEERKAAAEPSGMQYDRVAVLLQAVVKEHEGKINTLLEEINLLKNRINDLEA